jgi:NAD(P)H-dependent FMN reductase
MATAALAARIQLLNAKRSETAPACGLAFDEPGGPLIAVCGLVGGAGASTLALCLARQAAHESAAPVLLTELAASSAGLAVLAGQTSALSLGGLAQQVADGQTPVRAFVELEPGLRLLASPPLHDADTEPEHLRALLREARAAHGLVIVDCGTDWTATGAVLNQASHIVWTLPATRTALARAQALHASDILPRPGAWRELLAAAALDRRRTAGVRALRHLAGHRCERLVLIPHSEALARGDVAHGGEQLNRALTALAPTLRRAR